MKLAGVTPHLYDQMRDLHPGAFFKLTDRKGDEFAVMRFEDFEHYLELLGISYRNVDDPTTKVKAGR